jgi:hypothetical protein
VDFRKPGCCISPDVVALRLAKGSGKGLSGLVLGPLKAVVVRTGAGLEQGDLSLAIGHSSVQYALRQNPRDGPELFGIEDWISWQRSSWWGGSLTHVLIMFYNVFLRHTRAAVSGLTFAAANWELRISPFITCCDLMGFWRAPYCLPDCLAYSAA